MKNKNILILDIIRALCMLWIVAVWHNNDYLPVEYHWSNDFVPAMITQVALVTFTIMSGMLLSKYSFNSKSDVWVFYKKRFGRFYVLFILAAVTFYFCGFYSMKAFIKCVTGISLVLGRYPFTLWYMAMLMIFYILTPLLRYNYPKTIYSIIVFSSILMAMIILRSIHVMADNYPIIHFTSYGFGLLIGGKMIPWLKAHDWKTHASVRYIFEKIAYASFCMYLFHRVVYYLIGRIGGYADAGAIIFCMPVWCCILAVFLTLIISYGIQWTYDNLYRTLTNKINN